MTKTCDCCGESENNQALVNHGDEEWCLDCMRLAGHCISCDANIRLLVEDYYMYDDDVCPKCYNEENSLPTI